MPSSVGVGRGQGLGEQLSLRASIPEPSSGSSGRFELRPDHGEVAISFSLPGSILHTLQKTPRMLVKGAPTTPPKA